MAQQNQFPQTLEGFGYGFNEEGQLRQKDPSTGLCTDKPFEFAISSEHARNQKNYEALGEVITEYVYELLEKNGLHKIYVPSDVPESWPFWTKLVVVTVGLTGGVVFMYIQCRQYLQLCHRWRARNRILLIQNAPEKMHPISPPSPVIVLRNYLPRSGNSSTMLQTSNSLMNNSNFTNNNHINKSPTVSQPSSNSSSIKNEV